MESWLEGFTEQQKRYLTAFSSEMKKRESRWQVLLDDEVKRDLFRKYLNYITWKETVRKVYDGQNNTMVGISYGSDLPKAENYAKEYKDEWEAALDECFSKEENYSTGEGSKLSM